MANFDPPVVVKYDPEFPILSDDEESNSDGYHPLLTCRKNNNRSEQTPREGSSSSLPLVSYMAPVRKYTEKDLYPVDQSAITDPSEMLALFWPVYVSNFRLDSLEQAERNDQISSFFACKGLLSRMIFIREDDNFFRHHQRRTMLVDMLVYFTSQEDANEAILRCHKIRYYGHTLNVFSGRIPEYFDQTRSVKFRVSRGTSLRWTETPIEIRFARRGFNEIDTVMKYSESEVIIEFGTEELMKNAVRGEVNWVTSPLEPTTQKQRYLEQDYKLEILWKIEEQPAFIMTCPSQEILQELMAGRIPSVHRPGEYMLNPRPPPDITLTKLRNKNRKRFQEMKHQRWLRNQQKKASASGECSSAGSEQVSPEQQFKFLKSKYTKTQNKIFKKKYALLAAWTTPGPDRDQLLKDLFVLESQMQQIVAESDGKLYCHAVEMGLKKALQIAKDPDLFSFLEVNGLKTYPKRASNNNSASLHSRMIKVYNIWHTLQVNCL